MGKLEEYINKNREAFEVYDAHYEHIWEDVSKALDKHSHAPRGSLAVLWKIAASIVLLVGLAFLIFSAGSNRSLLKGRGYLTAASVEMADAEAYYTNLIDDKITRINQLSGETDHILQEQLLILDKDYAEMKNDLRDDADGEEVVNAMIEYYRLKLSLLENILRELENTREPVNNDKDVSI